jgi:glycosyltransferase involved in cell wall biosynthesis
MITAKTICIITNSHSTTDVRLYHKLAKSLCKIATVYIIGARGVGSMMENFSEDTEPVDNDNKYPKPIRIIASGITPILKLFSLYRQAIKLKPDLVICIEPLTMIVGAKIQKKTGCKLCYDAHEYYTAAHSERYHFPLNLISAGIYYLIEHHLQEKMDLTIAVNEDIFQMFNLKDYHAEKAVQSAETKPTHKHLRAPHNYGIICPNYPTSEIWMDDISACGISSLLPDTQFDTIYLGGITEERGIIKLLQVIAILRVKYPQFKALFVGPFHTEAFKKKFFNTVMDNNLNSHVYWRDSVAHDKVCAILRQVKIGLSILHPGYKRYRKALPLKVLEYLAAGIPVVANDFPQIKSIIEKNQLGYCVSFHKQDIANAIDKLLTLDSKARDAMAIKCRNVIKEQYIWSKIEPTLLNAVSKILNISQS